MTTETTFPVTPGNLITVKCPDGFIDQGSETITCQNGIHYEFENEPRCEAQGKTLFSLFRHETDLSFHIQCLLNLYFEMTISYLPADWETVTRDVYLTHDLEETPLEILTTMKSGVAGNVNLEVQHIGSIKVEFQRKRFSVDSCGYRYFPPNLPEEKNKIWTIGRTKEALTIICNGVEVLNLVYAEYDKYCRRKWSKTSAKIKLIANDQASDFMRSMHPGIFDGPFNSDEILHCLRILTYCLTYNIAGKFH